MTTDTEQHWELEAWRKPTLIEGGEEIFSEHGRIADKIDFRSHWFVLSKCNGVYLLLVHHGAGEERIPLGYNKRYETMMQNLDSNVRYYFMHALWNARHDGEKSGRSKTAATYREAFVDGRLKKRKLPNQASVKVWIEPKVITESAI